MRISLNRLDNALPVKARHAAYAPRGAVLLLGVWCDAGMPISLLWLRAYNLRSTGVERVLNARWNSVERMFIMRTHTERIANASLSDLIQAHLAVVLG